MKEIVKDKIDHICLMFNIEDDRYQTIERSLEFLYNHGFTKGRIHQLKEDV